MDMEQRVSQLVGTLAGFKPGGALGSSITHIRFPRFKGLERNATVKLDFPLVALVGANGAGKTSVLHALYGAPFGYSTAQFWFATELDPITGTTKDPQRFIYGHWNPSSKSIVETRKARLGKKRDYDYWEPYRTSAADGMSPMPKTKYEGMSKDRWNPVKKAVVYINLKMSFGSFDRYFYMDQNDNLSERRAIMLREAARLKRIKEDEKTSYRMGKRERVFANRLLGTDELKAVCGILGRSYDSARIIEHSLYPGNRGKDVTVIFSRGFEYSEAFAGTGEVSAVSVVVKVLAAPPGSLILLDEPETSLHPGAQRALLCFLLEQIKLKKHQVVISTHSGDMLGGLPDHAINVFEATDNGATRVINGCSPLIALNRLGRAPQGKVRILVEDPMAKLLVERAIEALDDGEKAIVEVRVAPGGAEAMVVHHGPGSMVIGDDVHLLIDGDKRRVTDFTKSKNIAPAQHANLEQILTKELGATPKFLLAGGDDIDGRARALVEAQLRYFDWIGEHLQYLPKLCPEQVIIDFMEGTQGGGGATSDACKGYLSNLLANGIQISNQDLLVLARIQIAKIPLDNLDLATIRHSIAPWLQRKRQ